MGFFYFSWFQLYIKHCTAKVNWKSGKSYFGSIMFRDVSTKIGILVVLSAGSKLTIIDLIWGKRVLKQQESWLEMKQWKNITHIHIYILHSENS